MSWLGVAASLSVFLQGCGGSGEAPSDVAPAAPTAPTAVPEAPVGDANAATGEERPVLEQTLAYGEGRRSNLEGYLAMPGDAAEPLPGIIVIHEAFGLNDDIRAIARRLAREGYVVLAVDLYGGATADSPERAQELMAELYADPDAARSNLKQAYDYLEKYAFAPRIGSVGWDLGAGWSLQTALELPDMLDAVVMYYGQTSATREQLATLAMPILGFFAGEDPSVPVRQVQDFRDLLMQLGKNAEILIMPGVNHAFATPGAAAYDERAAEETWSKTLAFLQRHLKLDTPTAQ